MKRFICANVIPGCAAVFTGPGDQSVLDQVLHHVAVEHGLVRPQLPFIELVMTHTRPFSPARTRRHLRLVGAAETGRSSTIATGCQVVDRRIPRESYRHECLLYAGADGFLDAVVPFVLDGLARREPVMVAVTEPRLRALRSALGQDACRVAFADMAELGANPARIVPAWRDFTNRHGDAPARGVGEPIWATRRPEEIAEAQLHEALLNVAVPADVPLWLMCPYDSTTLDRGVLAEAQRSHPAAPTTDPDGTQLRVEQLFGVRLPDPDAPTTTIAFDRDRHSHVEQVLLSADQAGLPVDRAVRLAAAIDELGMAADQDRGQVGIRLWQHPTAVVCEVTDRGTVSDPMVGCGAGIDGRSPRDRAVRLANELCDLVQLRSGHAGTTVRIHSWR